MRNKYELFCIKGTKLIVKNDIIIETGIDSVTETIPVGEVCQVEDIIGYGFDIKTESGYDIRILNSQMGYYFKKLRDNNLEKLI